MISPHLSLPRARDGMNPALYCAPLRILGGVFGVLDAKIADKTVPCPYFLGGMGMKAEVLRMYSAYSGLRCFKLVSNIATPETFSNR